MVEPTGILIVPNLKLTTNDYETTHKSNAISPLSAACRS